MNYSLLTSLGQPPDAYPFTPLDELDISPDSLPDCLRPYGYSAAWIKLSMPVNWALPTVPLTANLYLPQSLVKTQDPNQLFKQVKQLLDPNHLFAFRLVTAENIKDRLKSELSAPLFSLYYPFYFLFRRVLPKLKGFRKIHRLLNVPVDMSKAEIIGRLIYQGFDLVDMVETADDTFLIARSHPTLNPSLTRPLPSEGFLFTMRRMGRNSQPINVYKLRSMHPYAEYVQAYVHEKHGLDEGGKFKDDFRISTGGRVIRKYWLDELPMLVNLLKGDLKLVGVRPISEHYFSLYPPEAQVIRARHKPGLLPPFYADMPTSFNEIVASELTYLKAYEQAPWQTDLRYIKRILTNIFIHKARSK